MDELLQYQIAKSSTAAAFPTPLPIDGIAVPAITKETILGPDNRVLFYWTRSDLLWARVEPKEGERNWQAVSEFEDNLIKASASGINTIVILENTPQWALNADYACGAVASEKFPALQMFVSDMVTRYHQPPYNVKFWELWNEPDVENFLGCWGDKDDPYFGGGYYAEMLKVVYPSIKAADPEAHVLVGGLLLDCDPVNPPTLPDQPGISKDCSPANFLQGILNNSGGQFFDGVSFHAYDYYRGKLGEYANLNWGSTWNTTGPVLVKKSLYLRSLLEQAGVRDKFLMNTELALLCGRDGSEEPCRTENFENTKSYYIAQAYSVAAAEQLTSNIWYMLTGWRGSNLVDDLFRPLPALQAYQFITGQLKNSRFSREIADFNGVRGYEFVNGGRLWWILWSLDGNESSVQLPNLPATLFDVYGNPIEISATINVTIMPLIIQW